MNGDDIADLDGHALSQAIHARQVSCVEVMRAYLLGCEPHPIDSATPAEPLADADEWGSNNWALAPARTTTGRAILASDPHRVHDQPSLRYVVHLVAPGLDVIGAGEPAIPGVSFGHNERVAFSLTIHPADQEDLYVEQLDPANHGRYRFKDAWEPVRTVKEKIAVKGEAAREVDLSFTRHGVVLHTDQARHQSYALRSVWFEPGKSFYGGSTRNVPGEVGRKFLRAIDIQTGRIAWEHPQAGAGNTWGGVLSTVTGLVFFGEDSGAFAAVDGRSGKLLWHFPANTTWRGSPMTYAIGGEQFVAVAGGGNIFAFGL